MMSVKVSDIVQVGQIWRSEWDVEWRIVAVREHSADVKMVGGRSIHTVMGRELADWERVGEEAATDAEP